MGQLSWSAPDERAEGELLVRRAPGAVEVTFNRPDRLNAFTEAMYEELLALCAEVAEDRSVRVVVFRGAGGRAFAAGSEISLFSDFRSGGDGIAYEAQIRRVLGAIAALPQVTVAAVEGVCVGGGLAVAASCDLRICSPESRFGIPIARTLGNALSASIVLRCVEVFGDGLTREMLLASRLVSAERAYAVGAVMAVAPDGSLEAEVASVIDGVRQAARVTIEVTKEQLLAGAAGHDAAADDARMAKAYGGEDFREGVRAFLAKEKPRFRE